jgi:hypothetical protein
LPALFLSADEAMPLLSAVCAQWTAGLFSGCCIQKLAFQCLQPSLVFDLTAEKVSHIKCIHGT